MRERECERQRERGRERERETERDGWKKVSIITGTIHLTRKRFIVYSIYIYNFLLSICINPCLVDSFAPVTLSRRA